MICYRIYGGLGNQIFQILTALKLSAEFRTKMTLDFANLGERDFHFDFWSSQLSRFDNIEIDWTSKTQFERRELRHISELDLHSINLLNGNFDIHGWNPELLIFENLNFIRRGYFMFDSRRIETYPINQGAVHLRRGDYLLSPNLGLITDSYLENALKIVIGKGVRHLTVFSDDLLFAREWAESNTSQKIRVVVSDEKDTVRCLAEMSKYSTIITSNSTFSFWASYFSGGFAYVPFPFYNNVPRFDRDLYVNRRYSRHVIDLPRLIPAYKSYLRTSLVNKVGRLFINS